MAAGAILRIRKITLSAQRNARFWRNLVQWCVWALQIPTANKNSWFRKSKIAAAAILKNGKILISSLPNDRFWHNLACWCVSTLWTPIKFCDFRNPRWRRRPSLKFEKSQYLCNGTTVRFVFIRGGGWLLAVFRRALSYRQRWGLDMAQCAIPSNPEACTIYL